MKEKETRIKAKGIIPNGLGGASIAMSYMVISNLMYALTEGYGMAAVTVGIIFLVSRIFDGFTDIVAGFIIDRTNTKWGKARPFDLASIPLWIFVVLSFSVPNFNTVGKIVWVFLTYNLCQSVFYTLINGAVAVRLKRSFREEVRVKVTSAAALIAAIISMMVGVIFPILVGFFRNHPYGWTIISSCFAVPAILMSLTQFFFLKEMEDDGEKKEPEKISFLESVKLLFKNPYIFISCAAFTGLSIINGSSSVSSYYFTYIMGDISLASIVGLVTMIGMFFVVIMSPLAKRFGNKGTAMIGFALLAVFHLAKMIMGTNLIWLAICTVFAACGSVFVSGMKGIIIIDCMEYGYRKSGKQVEGLYASMGGLVDKLGLGLGSFLMGAILELGGYDGSLTVQSASANFSISFVYAILPAICGLIGFLIMLFYKEKIVKGTPNTVEL